MSAIKVCDCGRVKIGSAWIRCISVISQLREQGAEFEITECDECSSSDPGFTLTAPFKVNGHTTVGVLFPCGVRFGSK